MMSEVRLIQSIERAAAILEIIAQEGGAARLQHIAGQAKLGKTTAHNLLKTLDELGYVHRRPGDTRYISAVAFSIWRGSPETTARFVAAFVRRSKPSQGEPERWSISPCRAVTRSVISMQ